MSSSSSSSASKTLDLISCDGERFTVPLKSAQMSNLVKMASDPEVPKEVPLREVRSRPLASVTTFLKHYETEEYKYINKPLKSNKFEENVPAWDAEFLSKLKKDELFELVLAANYLDIKELLDLVCAKVACSIRDATVEDLRKSYNIKNDFAPAEETAIIDEQKWLEEA